MKRIFLTGYMGVGKTTIGQNLAKRLNISFIDLDNYIEIRYHKTISAIFSEKGEDAFRLIEHNLLKEVAMFEDVLISTGGGAPCFFDNMELMNRVGETVYLKASPRELTRRLARAKQGRPIISERSGDELFNFISESLEKREPFYRQAHITFDTESMFDYQNMSKGILELERLLLTGKGED